MISWSLPACSLSTCESQHFPFVSHVKWTVHMWVSTPLIHSPLLCFISSLLPLPFLPHAVSLCPILPATPVSCLLFWPPSLFLSLQVARHVSETAAMDDGEVVLFIIVPCVVVLLIIMGAVFLCLHIRRRNAEELTNAKPMIKQVWQCVRFAALCRCVILQHLFVFCRCSALVVAVFISFQDIDVMLFIRAGDSVRFCLSWGL